MFYKASKAEKNKFLTPTIKAQGKASIHIVKHKIDKVYFCICCQFTKRTKLKFNPKIS